MLTQEEKDAAIAKLYLEGVKLSEIQERLGVTNIPRIVKRLGLPNRRSLNRWSQTEEERTAKNAQIAEAYRQGATIKEIEQSFGFSNAGGNIARILRSQGIEPDRGTPIDWNTDFFNNRDTITAYWAGFLFADGCLESEHHRLALCSIHIQDYDHVCRFADAIGADRSRVTVDNHNRVGIKVTGDQKLRDSLAYWGIVSRKTRVWVQPQIECPKLLKAFIVGLIDGDGHIRRGEDKHGNYNLEIASNHKPLYDWLLPLLRSHGYTGHFACYQDRTGFCRIITAGKENLFNLMLFLNPVNLPCLHRKWYR